MVHFILHNWIEISFSAQTQSHAHISKRTRIHTNCDSNHFPEIRQLTEKSKQLSPPQIKSMMDTAENVYAATRRIKNEITKMPIYLHSTNISDILGNVPPPAAPPAPIDIFDLTNSSFLIEIAILPQRRLSFLVKKLEKNEREIARKSETVCMRLRRWKAAMANRFAQSDSKMPNLYVKCRCRASIIHWRFLLLFCFLRAFFTLLFFCFRRTTFLRWFVRFYHVGSSYSPAVCMQRIRVRIRGDTLCRFIANGTNA